MPTISAGVLEMEDGEGQADTDSAWERGILVQSGHCIRYCTGLAARASEHLRAHAVFKG